MRLALAGYRGRGVKLPLYNYHVASGGMLFSRSSELHSELWRRIRSKHPAAYKLPAMLRLWRTTRDGSGRVSLVRGLVAIRRRAASCRMPGSAA